jgi:chorismate-pyruvate lyase
MRDDGSVCISSAAAAAAAAGQRWLGWLYCRVSLTRQLPAHNRTIMIDVAPRCWADAVQMLYRVDTGTLQQPPFYT